MKIRLGFVSNSSSSSFVCDVCGREDSGYDLGLEEAGMKECENGHTFCDDHQEKSGNEEDRYECPPEICPVCNFKVLLDFDLGNYLLKKIGTSRSSILGEISSQFETYKDFKDSLKK